mmetsp:Transcript_4969/g.7173  ORF Transcript_4969/g.7173 Transcript_4969/m.7173 type:complete len:193 (-) Transcript_4969:731-1309(-)|eukprot:CAMPEP_0194257480 /NCGR_PEP_ID=MMETSP0158-20130606/39119_1 /TAXON_ID=33649 /ORGANISM="Thalassionema nitzschioides, Strain L26-B" /LENGTH=192 /DNA_ID=CAMNT_0038996535 /DNA_START=39 /DNA_END=617 /DNA_ORIENTATION=+
MNIVPHDLLVEIFSYLPQKAYLPYANISRRYKKVWEDRCLLSSDCDEQLLISRATNPMELGNVLLSPWYMHSSKVSTKLLEYYISCGWDFTKNSSILIRESLSRGDIAALNFLVEHCQVKLDDSDYCAVAGAAGQLQTLKLLREVHHCPWDPDEVYQEAIENHHESVMDYLEHKLLRSYNAGACTSYGMPWP